MTPRTNQSLRNSGKHSKREITLSGLEIIHTLRFDTFLNVYDFYRKQEK
jgi:hypothetical protein